MEWRAGSNELLVVATRSSINDNNKIANRDM
jgi:hypothetical protein